MPSSVPWVSSVPVSSSSAVVPPRLMPAVVTALARSSRVSVAGCTEKVVRVCRPRISAPTSRASATSEVWPETLPATAERRPKACTSASMSTWRGSSSADTRKPRPSGSTSSRACPFHVPPPASMRVRQRSSVPSRSSRRRTGDAAPARSRRSSRGRQLSSNVTSPS
ncbi:hypothetical protein D3C87_664780 [compost metagenome]